jgi:bifunctional oligoribonuclease and PAP phosphatase NrnA
MTQTPSDPSLQAVSDALRTHDRFIVTSHVRPDGDAIGSSVAMALALRSLGKSARVVMHDPLPDPYPDFPCVDQVECAERVPDDGSTVVVMECGDLDRTGLGGIEGHAVINIDHHPGNAGFGFAQWFDGTAAACAEMVYDIIVNLGVVMTADMATHLYVGIVTDTGSFKYPGVSPRTFITSARLVEAGADPVALARLLYDGNTLGRLKLQAAVLSTLDIRHDGTIACLMVDPAMLAAAGAAPEDTDGFINIPLTVRRLVASVFFKMIEPDTWRVSLRSKGAIDVGRIARHFGGGGHRNASGCTLTGTLPDVRALVLDLLGPEVTEADTTTPHHRA